MQMVWPRSFAIAGIKYVPDMYTPDFQPSLDPDKPLQLPIGKDTHFLANNNFL